MGLFDSLFGRRRDAFRGQADRDWRALVPQDVQRVPSGELGRKRVVRSKLPTVAAMIFLGVLGAGNSSLLWSELREKRKLVHAIDASGFGIRDLGLAWCSWSGEAGADAAVVERAIAEAVDGLLQRGVSADEFAKVRRQSVVGMVNGQKNIHGLTSRVAHAATIGFDVAGLDETSYAAQVAELFATSQPLVPLLGLVMFHTSRNGLGPAEGCSRIMPENSTLAM